MKKEMTKYINLITTYGKYAKPFINYALKHEELQEGWRCYFIAKKYSWAGDYKKALEYLKKAEDNIVYDSRLRYLILLDKTSHCTLLKDKRADKYYTELKKNYSRIPYCVRKTVAAFIINHEVLFYDKEKNIYSRPICEDKTADLYLSIGEARKCIKRNEYLKSSKKAVEIPHPSGLTVCLNDPAWYLMDINLNFAKTVSFKDIYYLSYFFDNYKGNFDTFDTAHEVLKKKKDADIFSVAEAASLICEDKTFEFSNENHKKIAQDFIDIYNIRNKKLFDNKNLKLFFEDKLSNLSEIRRNTGIDPKTLKKIISGESSTGISTLKKLVHYFRIVPDLTMPYEVITAYLDNLKDKIVDYNLYYIKSLSVEQRKHLFISIYSSLYIRKKVVTPLTIKKNLKEFYNEFISCDEIKLKDSDYKTFFISKTNTSEPFYKARFDLSNNFFNSMHHSKLDGFIESYIDLYENDRILMDSFIRNYTRYDRKWEVKLKAHEELKLFIKKFKLKEVPAVASYFCIEPEINFLDKFIISGIDKNLPAYSLQNPDKLNLFRQDNTTVNTFITCRDGIHLIGVRIRNKKININRNQTYKIKIYKQKIVQQKVQLKIILNYVI